MEESILHHGEIKIHELGRRTVHSFQKHSRLGGVPIFSKVLNVLMGGQKPERIGVDRWGSIFADVLGSNRSTSPFESQVSI